MASQQLLQHLDRLGVATLVPGHQREVVAGRHLAGVQPEALPELRLGFREVPLHV